MYVKMYSPSSAISRNEWKSRLLFSSLLVIRYPVEQNTPFLIVRWLRKPLYFISFPLAASDLEGPIAFRNFGTVSLEVRLHCRHVTDRKEQFILQSLLGGVLW
jgi:hypothetical protein